MFSIQHDTIKICKRRKNIQYVINNILKVIQNYKEVKLSVEDGIDIEMIIECFRKNTDPIMRDILYLITYADPLVLNTSLES
jgi:hypothetical protein